MQKENISIFIIWLVTLSGVIGIAAGKGDWFLPKTPMNLLLGAGLLLWNFPAKNGLRSWALWSVAFLIGMGVEMLGVNYGLLFGDYHYGENLGPKVLGVPLLIGINWVVLTFLTSFISQRFFTKRWPVALSGASLMVGLDFLIEPIAPLFDFWHWDIGHAPLQNFVAWLGVSFLLQLMVYDEVPRSENSLPFHHFASQVVFFGFFWLTLV